VQNYSVSSGGEPPDSVIAGFINDAKGRQYSPSPFRPAEQVADAYGQAVQQNGGQYLPRTDPRVRGIYEAVGGVPNQGQSQWAADAANGYAGAMGRPASGRDLMGIIERARRQRPSTGDRASGPTSYAFAA
jgi:hypothetical protein